MLGVGALAQLALAQFPGLLVTPAPIARPKARPPYREYDPWYEEEFIKMWLETDF